jgi:hypothetical protein
MSQQTNAASRFRSLLASERRSADLYSGLAEAASAHRREVLTELAAVQRRHAAHWAGKLTELGEPVPPAERPGLRTSALSWLARRLCIDAVLPYLERSEHADAGRYHADPDATAAMAVDERSHASLARMSSPATAQHCSATTDGASGDEFTAAGPGHERTAHDRCRRQRPRQSGAVVS